MNKIEIHHDTINHPKIKKDINIIHIADIHFNKETDNKKLNKIKDTIIKYNPDYITITGDLIDNPKIIKDKIKIKELLLFLTSLTTNSKVIISLGNHDLLKESDIKFYNKLNDLKNIYLLDNSIYQDDYLYMVGLTLPNNYYYNLNKQESIEILIEHLTKHKRILNNIKVDIPKIGLIHSPINLTNKEVLSYLKEFDLLLSGHSHGGMVPSIMNKLFKPNQGIIAPNKKLFPEVARGKIKNTVNNKDIILIITSGITKLSIQSTKILNKLNFIYNSDINHIKITRKKGKKYE